MYNNLIHTENNEALLRGDILHDFAAFYATYPEIVNAKGDDYFVDEMMKHYKKIAEDISLDAERSKFMIGIKNIREFIDNQNIDEKVLLPNVKVSSNNEKNHFFELLGLKANSNNAEVNFQDDQLYLVGKIDLISDPRTIVDFKSSKKKKTASEITRQLNPLLIKDIVDFQPMIYMLELEYSDSESVEFIYEYPISNYKNVINGDAQINDTVICVKYYKKFFNEFLQTQEAMELIASSSERRKFMEKVGFDCFIDFFREHPLSFELQFDSKKLLSSIYRQTFQDYIISIVRNNFKVKAENVDDILKKIVNIRTGYREKSVLIFKDDIVKFKSLIEEKYNEICQFINDRFPFKPLNKEICEKCNYKDICLKEY